MKVEMEPFGGLKFGNGLSLNGDTLNVTIGECTCTPYTLPTATKTVKGGVKVGHSLMMNGNGNQVLNVALDTISSTIEGFLWIHDVDYVSSG